MSKKQITIGTKLRDWRKGKKLSTKEAGALVGVSGVQWYRYESGDRSIPFDRLIAISLKTGLSLSRLNPTLVKQVEAAQ